MDRGVKPAHDTADPGRLHRGARVIPVDGRVPASSDRHSAGSGRLGPPPDTVCLVSGPIGLIGSGEFLEPTEAVDAATGRLRVFNDFDFRTLGFVEVRKAELEDQLSRAAVESFVSFQAPAGNVDPLGDDPLCAYQPSASEA